MKKKNELTFDERAQAEARIEQLETQLASALEELRTVKDRLDLADRHLVPQDVLQPAWSEVNESWATICKSAVDTSRLVGLEIELDNGQRFLIGDLSPDGGTGPANMPFPRAAVVKRARVLVRR